MFDDTEFQLQSVITIDVFTQSLLVNKKVRSARRQVEGTKLEGKAPEPE